MNATSTILIADDDPNARFVTQTLLAQEGYTLLTAASGAEAIRQAFEHLPSLLLLDVLMPDIDGFTICRQLRDHPQTQDIPILMVTSLDDSESRVRGLRVGADGFISKPFNQAELLAQVRTITRLDRYRRLLSEQERFQRLIQLSPEGIAIIDSENRLLLANPALAELLEVTDAEYLVGRSLLTYIPTAMLDRYRAILASLNEDTQPMARIELALLSAQGTSIPVEISLGRFNDSNGAYAQIIAHNIAERKQAEAQIQRQINQLTSLHAIGVAITASLEINVTLDVLLDRLIAQLYIDAASVLLIDSRSQRLEPLASRGLTKVHFDKYTIHPGEGLAGKVFLSHRPVSLPSINSEVLHSPRDKDLASTFTSYFALPLRARGEIKGVLEIMHRTTLIPDQHWWSFLESLALQAAIAIDTAAIFEQLQFAHAELRHSYEATIEGWARALELRDHETEGHSERVTELTMQLAQSMNIATDDFEHIRRGALLHDIGKMGIPDSILLKNGPLSTEEWAVIRQHPTYAFRWLAPIPFLRPALAIPYAHHELWDGSGYPLGLRGDHIPLPARIFTVVDVWDALRSPRPYRAAWSRDQVIAYLRSLSGKHFDPQVVDAFLEMIGGGKKI